MCRSCQDHPQAQWFTRTHGTQRTVMLTAVIYLSERIQSTISEEERLVGWSPAHTRVQASNSPLLGSHRISPDKKDSRNKSWYHLWNAASQESMSETQSPVLFVWTPSARVHQDSRLLTPTTLFRQTKCTQWTILHSSGNGGNLLKSKFVDARQGSTLQPEH